MENDDEDFGFGKDALRQVPGYPEARPRHDYLHESEAQAEAGLASPAFLWE